MAGFSFKTSTFGPKVMVTAPLDLAEGDVKVLHFLNGLASDCGSSGSIRPDFTLVIFG